MIPRTPRAIEALHRLHRAADVESNLQKTQTAPPPRHERASRILAYVIAGICVGGFGAHMLAAVLP